MGMFDKDKVKGSGPKEESLGDITHIATLPKSVNKTLGDALVDQFPGIFGDASLGDAKAMKVIEEILHTGTHRLTALERARGEKEHNIIDVLRRNAPRLLENSAEAARMAHKVASDIVGFGVITNILSDYPDATDIGYNGRMLTVETNTEKIIYAINPERVTSQHLRVDEFGQPYPHVIDNDVEQLIAKYSHIANKGFSSAEPIFNGFTNNMRVSALHSELSPLKAPTLSIRISHPRLALNEQNFANFAPMQVYKFLTDIVLAKGNIMISGETGTGKTELLKLLVKSIPFKDRIIMIEDVAETELNTLYPDKEIYDWLTKTTEKNEKGKGITISDLVKASLRNNPTWLMVSETRGSEAYEMYNAVLTGHALITTLHAISNEAVPSRFVTMSSMAKGVNIDPEDLTKNFLRYMHLGIHISKKVFSDGRLLRFLDELVMFDPDAPHGVRPLFKQRLYEEDGIITRYYRTYPIPDELIDMVRDRANIENMDYWKTYGSDEREAEEEIKLDKIDRTKRFKHVADQAKIKVPLL